MLTSKQGLCIFILNPYLLEFKIQEHSVPKNSCNLSIKLNENDFSVVMKMNVFIIVIYLIKVINMEK